MKYINNIYSSPYILSFLPFIIIVLIIHGGIKPYSLETESSLTVTKDTWVWFDDLDNDGSSERLVAVNQPTSTGLAISNDNGIINQFGFRGSYNFERKTCLFITGDKDNDGIKEIYAFTLSDDSIFLHIVPDFRKSGTPVNRFIAVTGKGLKSPDPFIIPAEMEDLDNDGIKELIFGIGSGYSEYPRRVFAYYISKDSLVASPESSYFIWRITQADINGDGRKEIIPYGYATTNITPEKAKYHDQSSYLMVLDKDLKFLFPPVEFPGRFSKVTPFIMDTENGSELGILYNQASGLTHSTVYFVSTEGRLTDSVQLGRYAIDISRTTFGTKKNIFLLSVPPNSLFLLNSVFQPLKRLSVDNPFIFIQKDLDLDGREEILITAPETGRITIYREGLNKPVSITIPFDVSNNDIITLKVNHLSPPLISLQSGQRHYMLKYGRNPAYPFYLFIYPGIYLAILAFVLTIKNMQKNQLKRKYDNEKRIARLQLALIKSQLDPHFTLNAINSIIYSLEYTDRNVAGDQLRRFANLYRNLLLSATSVQWSIQEELDFCSDYLLLEKMRFGEKLSYDLTVSNEVNKSSLVPKLFIQIHVENAIKHGLTLKEEGGQVTITLRQDENNLFVEVADNGIGREKSRSMNKMTTAKGLEIMSELYSIYNKYYDEKVSYEILDLYDESGGNAGTRVNIRISNLKANKQAAGNK